VHRGLVHRYLGMTINYSTKGVAQILMVDYVKDIVMAWDKASDGIELNGFKIKYRKLSGKPTAAPLNLFMVDEDLAKLPEKQKAAFYNVVTKALYMAKRAWPNIAVSIAFLTTRVHCPDVQDWVKLCHAVHPNMRGHSGGAITLGLGFPISSSGKQKLNTRSSAESKLVGVDDIMSLIIWSRKFLKAQGYVVVDNILHQDNRSAILLEQNGKMSSGKRTKHIAIPYFFVTDRIRSGEISPKWCPTGEMIADFLTKPLQGAMFWKFRDLLMGVVPTVNTNELPAQ
jgi:hypothetical protein